MAAQDSAALERTAGQALQMMAEAVYAGGFLEFRPSLVAAGVLTSARRAAGAWPFWPSSLVQLTGDCHYLHFCTFIVNSRIKGVCEFSTRNFG